MVGVRWIWKREVGLKVVEDWYEEVKTEEYWKVVVELEVASW